MQRNTKALIATIFVFPGAGHIFLKRYFFATVAILVSVVCMSFLIVHAVAVAQVIVAQILQGQTEVGVFSLNDLIKQERHRQHSPYVSASTIILIVTWLIAGFDTYRITRRVKK